MVLSWGSREDVTRDGSPVRLELREADAYGDVRVCGPIRGAEPVGCPLRESRDCPPGGIVGAIIGTMRTRMTTAWSTREWSS